MRNIFSSLKRSTILRSFRVLPTESRRKVVWALVLQISLSFLDLVGVATIGILGALAVSGIQSQVPGDRISQVLRILNMETFSFQVQITMLGLGACFILIVRTVLSIKITRKVLFFLSKQGALISANLLNRLLGQSLLQIQSRTTQETLYSVTTGVTAITLGILGTTVALIADISLLTVLILGLFAVDSLIAITSILFFGLMGYVLYRMMSVRAQELGVLNSELNVFSNSKIIEVLDSFRESLVRNTRQYYSREIGKSRLQLADISAEMQFMPSVSKYVIESGMVVGAVLIAGTQFAVQDAKHAVATLSVFLAAGTRIAPAILRLQQNLVQIKNAIGSAAPAWSLMDSLTNSESVAQTEIVLNRNHLNFKADVSLSSVSITYPSNPTPALQDISLNVRSGESLAIVGPSGAGKTTLVDVLLGVLREDQGEVSISGLKPLEAIEKWPGAIAYVPQSVNIINGTIRENVAIGFPIDENIDVHVMEALRLAQLENFVSNLPNGLDSQVGDRGTMLSGGQQQRLGIARALFTNPKLLVLDEATSSLDGQTELDISEAIHALHGQVTVILIAHRLSTVRTADQVIYMSEGKIRAQGTFNEVRGAVPDFDQQAKLMGL